MRLKQVIIHYRYFIAVVHYNHIFQNAYGFAESNCKLTHSVNNRSNNFSSKEIISLNQTTKLELHQMSNDNIVSNTKPDEEESPFKLEKNNLLSISKEPQMTEEQQKEVLCDDSGKREADNQDNDGAYPAISPYAKILSQDVTEGKVGSYPTSSGVDPPSPSSKNIHASTEPTDSKQLLNSTKNDLGNEVTDKDSDKPMTGSSYSTREAWQRLEDELTQFLSLDTEIQDRSNTCLVAGAYEIDDIDSSSDLASDISFLPTRKSSLSQRLLNSTSNNERLESETIDVEDGELPAKGRH